MLLFYNIIKIMKYSKPFLLSSNFLLQTHKQCKLTNTTKTKATEKYYKLQKQQQYKTSRSSRPLGGVWSKHMNDAKHKKQKSAAIETRSRRKCNKDQNSEFETLQTEILQITRGSRTPHQRPDLHKDGMSRRKKRFAVLQVF